MVVPVLMTSCQVSLKWKYGPVNPPDQDDAAGEGERAGASSPARHCRGRAFEPETKSIVLLASHHRRPLVAWNIPVNAQCSMLNVQWEITRAHRTLNIGH